MKRVLSFLLILCILVSISMPAVYATQQTAAQPADLKVDFQTVFNNAGVAANTYLQNATSQLNAAYATNKWTVYCDNDGNSIKPNNLYAGGRNKGGFLELKNNNIPTYGKTAILPSVFVAPGSGEYQLSFTYGSASSSYKTGAEIGAYILEKPETPYTKYNVPMPTASNILSKATEVTPGSSGTATANTTATLKSGVEYILVFYVTSDDTIDCYVNFKDFSLNFVSPNLTVDFSSVFNNAGVAANTYLQNATSQLNAAYATNKWTLYCDASGASVRPNSLYAGGRNRVGFLELKNNNIPTYGETAILPSQFIAPATGEYQLSVTYGTASQSDRKGAELGAYILEMPEEPYTKYNVPKPTASNILTKASQTDPGATGTILADNTVVLRDSVEYIIVFYVTSPDTTDCYANFKGFSLNYIAAAEPEEPTVPEEPTGPNYTEGLYDFYTGSEYGTTLNDGKDGIAQDYDNGLLNWKFEAMSAGMKLTDAIYNATTNSMRVIAAKEWWLAVRIKAPKQDGQYAIKMTHGAGGSGASEGSIYVIPGDTPESKITLVSLKTGAAMTTDWFYGESTSDTIGGRETTTGTVNLKADEEYIVVFLPTASSNLNHNAYFWLGQLSLTRIGDYVEDEVVEEEESILYEFYDWDHPGDYLYHYKMEEELGKAILTEEIAAQYVSGERNWCYQPSNGYANFSSGMPYLNITAGEAQYFCLKIKSPGTGTYEITYDYMARVETNAATNGSVYIVPFEDGMEYADILDGMQFKTPTITTTYYNETNKQMSTTGSYSAFQEGKEYLVCFSVEDDDDTQSSSLQCYPQALSMVRTGEYVAEAAHPTTGKCGENVTWTLDETGTLTISGTGAMDHYTKSDKTPWCALRYKISKVVIESGVTGIGDFAFCYCTKLTTVEIPYGIVAIGNSAFYNCSNLDAVHYTGTAAQKAEIAIGDNNASLLEAKWDVALPPVCEYVDNTGTILAFDAVEKALPHATNGTIRLIADATVGTILLKPGVTLDLNGNTLTADLVAVMNGATILDGGAACIGGGKLLIAKENLAYAKGGTQEVIPVWNGVDGYVFTKVTFQQLSRASGEGASQYIFLPTLSNADAFALLVDGSEDNGLKVKVRLTWAGGQSQQFYTYQDALVEQVFSSNGRLVFSLNITGIAGITDMVANAIMVTDTTAQTISSSTTIKAG